MSEGAPPDLIFFGGDIVTVVQGSPETEALAVRDGRILAVGARQDVMALSGIGTREIDLAGRTLLPGFVDAHTHPLLTGLLHGAPTINISPFHVADYAEARAKMAAAIADAKPGEYLFFFGIEFLLYKGAEPPTLFELDRLAPDNPLVILTNNCHTAFGNGLAFARAGIDAVTPDPPGGHFERHASGNLTGTAIEFPGVLALLQPYLEDGGEERRRRALASQIELHMAAGFTTIADLALEPEHYDDYRALVAGDHPPVRVRVYEKIGDPGPAAVPLGSGDQWFKQIGMKLWADGSPYVGNIWLSQPYRNTPVTLEILGFDEDNTGSTNYSQEELQALVDRYYAEGWQIAVHAQGDRTIDMVLDVYEAAIGKSPRPDHRLRMEHCGALTDAQVRRASDLGVTISFFPCHIYYYGDVLVDDLFLPEVAERWMPMGSAVDAGMRFSMHNDPPMTPPNPLLNIQTAVLRKARTSGRTLGPGQRIDVDAAIRAQTIDAAYQLFMEDDVGSLVPGKAADLLMLSANPRRVEPETISRIEVLATYVAGKPAWSAS